MILKITPKINSIDVIKAQPISAFINKLSFLKVSLILANTIKQIPPAVSMEGCVYPRQRISIKPYPKAPIVNKMEFLLKEDKINHPEYFAFFKINYTLKRKRTISPSFITYSLPSLRTKPFSFAVTIFPPQAIKSS